MLGHVPLFSRPGTQPVYQTLSRHYVIWQQLQQATIYIHDSCNVWYKAMYCY